MNAFFNDYLLFVSQTVTVILAVFAVIIGATLALARTRRPASPPPGRLTVTRLNEHFDSLQGAVESTLLPPREAQQRAKERAAARDSTPTGSGRWRPWRRGDRGDEAVDTRRRVFVVDFDGDLWASAVTSLREEVNAIVATARPEDEVVVRLESGGGLVPHYGLAAAQLERLRARHIRVTVFVDRIAASGGYLMAVVGDRIHAAPFAVVGSIGVVAQLPNLHRYLKARDIDVEHHQAGAFKRTLTVFGENTEEARRKFQADLDATHGLFKAFVERHRPDLDIDRVATGEFWYGNQALELHLIDAIQTSDDYLVEAAAQCAVIKLAYERRKALTKRLFEGAARHLGRRLGDGSSPRVAGEGEGAD